MTTVNRLHVPSVLLAVLLFLSVMVACQESELPSPIISTISPDTGPVGTEITVIGSNLGETIEQVQILFGATLGETVSVNATRVLVKVPTLAAGVYSLGAKLGDRTSKSSIKFTVLEKPVISQPDPFDLLAPGMLDPTFGDKGVARSQETLQIESPETSPEWLTQPDGKFVLVSAIRNPIEVHRWNVDISPDKTFGSNGVTELPVTIGAYGGNVLPQIQRSPNGKYLVILRATSTFNPAMQMWMINADGGLDQSFGKNGTISIFDEVNIKSFVDAAPLSNGKVMVLGSNSTKIVLRRYLLNGKIDSSFGINGDLNLDLYMGELKIKVFSNDTLFIYGIHPSDPYSGSVSEIIKINTEGVKDDKFRFFKQYFSEPAKIDYYFQHNLIEQNGKIYLIGRTDGTNPLNKINRILPDGSFDNFFQITTNLDVHEFTTGSDGSFILFGSSPFLRNPAIERYDSKGTLDTKFGDSGRLIIAKGGAETIAASLVGSISGKKITAYGILGSGVSDGYAPEYRVFAARIKY